MDNTKPVSPNWNTILPDEPVELGEPDWTEIVSHSDLPPEARPVIGKAIALFRTVENAGRYSLAELSELHRGAEELHAKLLKTLDNPHAHFALTVPIITEPGARAEPRLQAHQRLVGLFDQLEHLAKWLALASERVESGRPGAARKAENVFRLVGMLDDILEYFVGNKISRSKKKSDHSREYITAVLRIADETIGGGTIEHAMQKRIRLRGRLKR